MQPYMERAADVACESLIAVQVLLSRGNDSIELIPLKPQQHQGEYITREEFTARQLRSVGIVGLCGLRLVCALKEPLEPTVVDAIATAFLEYLRVLLGSSFAGQQETAEIAEIERLCALPDTRPN